MKFGLVLAGSFLLIVGLLAYSMIPNFHAVPLQSAQMVVSSKPIPVSSDSLSETNVTVTVFPGRENELLVNLTVSTQSGVPSSIQFKFFPEAAFQSCMLDSQQRGCLFNQTEFRQYAGGEGWRNEFCWTRDELDWARGHFLRRLCQDRHSVGVIGNSR